MSKTKEKMTVKQLYEKLLELFGDCPKTPYKWDGKWGAPFGKSNKYRLINIGNIIKVYDHTDNEKQIVFSATIKDAPLTSPIKKSNNSNPLKVFKSQRKATNNNEYLKERKVTLPKNYDIREGKKGLYVPYYRIQDKKFLGYQIISLKNKIFNKGGGGSEPFCWPGNIKDSKHIFVCEGFSTALSVLQITGEGVAVAFGKNRLESCAEALNDKYMNKKIIVCLDNDGPGKILKTSWPNTVIPPKKGDFNDLQDDRQTQNILLQACGKLKIDLSPLFSKPSKKNIKPIEYLDSLKNILKGEVLVLSGEKGSMKTTGVLTYLLKQNIKIGYFSDHENSESTISKIAFAAKKAKNLIFMNLDEMKRKDICPGKRNEFLKEMSSQASVDLIMEDPPYDDGSFSNQEELRAFIGCRVEIAHELGITWIITRNFNKGESKNELNKVSGFGIITNMPRAVLMTFMAEKKSKAFTTAKREAEVYFSRKDLLQTSIIQTVKTNLGPTPQHSIQTYMFPGENEYETVVETRPTFRISKPSLWGKETDTVAEKDRTDTRIFRVLKYIDESNDDIHSLDIIGFIIKKLEMSKRTAERMLKKLKDKKLVTGGGRGKNTKPFKISDKGKEFLNGEEEENPITPPEEEEKPENVQKAKENLIKSEF